MNEKMKIISLQCENIKILKAVTITPHGNMVVLSGPNGAGKSTCLDAIEMALAGAEHIGKRPIRTGASSGKIVCKLPGLVVTRTFGAAGTTLKITNDEGVTQKSPQGILDALYGQLAFDPLEFSRMKPEPQLATLRKLVGLDTSAIDTESATIYAQRTQVNRDLDVAKQRLALNPHDATAPETEVVFAELTSQLTKINDANALNSRLRDRSRDAQATMESSDKNVTDAVAELNRLKSLVVAQEAKVERARSLLDMAKAAAATAQASADAAKDEDTAPVMRQINEASDINRKVQSNRQHAEWAAAVEAKSKRSRELTETLEGLSKKKADALAACKFPLPGLSIDGNEILFGGLPFDQASTAEKLRVSVAIGMALSPKLRVMFVRDGSLLDPNGLQIIADMAKDQDYQIWMEDARSIDPMAVIITDGMVKSEPTPEI